MGMTNGSQVTNADFSFARSVSITFALTLSEQSYFVTRTQALSIPNTISSVVGSLTGVLSFLGTVLAFIEKCRSAPGADSQAPSAVNGGDDSRGGDEQLQDAAPTKNPAFIDKNPLYVDTASVRSRKPAASLGARADSLYVGVDGPGVEMAVIAPVSPRIQRIGSVLPRDSTSAAHHETVARMLVESARRLPADSARPALVASSSSSVYSPPPPALVPVAPNGAGRVANQPPSLQPRHRAILERFRDATGGDADF
jgi:hypothetical protein